MLVVKSRLDWLKKHATREKSTGLWICNETGVTIKEIVTGRPIWVRRPYRGGFGEVRKVAYLYCSECEGKPQIRYGEPIYEDEIA